jgi:hypothetical protein
MKFKLMGLILALPLVGIAGERMDARVFYGARTGQLFKATDRKELVGGFVRGDEEQYWTWRDHFLGSKLYLELHANKLTVISGNRRTVSTLDKAIAFKDDRAPGLDPRGIDLYVKAGRDDAEGFICLESLVPYASKTIPFAEVYLLVFKKGLSTLYKLPERNAACGAIERNPKHELLIPKWAVDPSSASKFRVDYYSLSSQGFRVAGISMKGCFISEDEYYFSIDE